MRSRRRLLVFQIGLALTGIALMAEQAHAGSVKLSVSASCQEKTKWCWVAFSQSMIRFHNNEQSQCQVYKWGKNISSCGGNDAGDLSDMKRAMEKGGLKNVSTTGGAVYFVAPSWCLWCASIKSEIDASRPLGARAGWKSSSKKTAHVVPIRGYDDRSDKQKVHYLYIRNCSSSTQSKTADYSWFKDNSDWKWTHTVYGMRK